MRNDFCLTLIYNHYIEIYFGGVPLFYNFWDDFKYIELVESKRQKSDPIFFYLLRRVRLVIPTEEDIVLLESN